MIQNCLARSRFIAFLDECGDHSLSKIDKDFPLFLLSTVLVEQHENQLPVIAEARGQQEDNALRAGFQRLMTQGTDYNGAGRFQKLVCPISFRRKHDNIAGIQLADLCAHPTARHLLNPGIANQAFEVVRQHLYASGRVNGFKVYPK